MSLSYPTVFLDGATSLPPVIDLEGETSNVLPYSYLQIMSGVYLCDVIYGDQTIQSDAIDTSLMFEYEGNIYIKTSETEVAFLKVGSEAKSCAIPEALTYEGVSYRVTAISDYAFADCPTLESIVCMLSDPLAVKTSTFASVPATLIIYVQTAKVSAYQSALVWQDYTIRAIDSYPAKVYNGCSSAIDVTINLPNKPSEATALNSLCFVDKNVRMTTEESHIIPNLIFKDDASEWIAKEMYITDAQPFYCPYNINAESIFYTRHFATNTWQALYLPFPMKYEDWADKAEVAYINNVHQFDDDEDGEIDRTILEFIRQKSGSIEPNKPYVIKPKQTGEVTFTSANTTLFATPEADGYVDCRSTTTEYTLYGTYQEKKDMYSSRYYAMSNGNFMAADNDAVTLAPFRAYLKIENRTGADPVQNARRINIMVDGIIEDATGIESTFENNNADDIFNLAGQKVSSNYKGIIVRNGKKHINK